MCALLDRKEVPIRWRTCTCSGGHYKFDVVLQYYTELAEGTPYRGRNVPYPGRINVEHRLGLATGPDALHVRPE